MALGVGGQCLGSPFSAGVIPSTYSEFFLKHSVIAITAIFESHTILVVEFDPCD
jgi:hypothetical protein